MPLALEAITRHWCLENMNNIKNYIPNYFLFEKTVGYTYKDKKNLLLALTHSSYANESRDKNLESNERLEFLGDAVLNIVISDYIYRNYAWLSEGDMTKARARIVCEASLVQCAAKLGLGSFLLLGKGEEMNGGRSRASILSDAFEAVIGSIYLDGGLEMAGRFIISMLKERLDDFRDPGPFFDFKTQLQELVQKKGDDKVTYELVEEKGPDHDKTFVVKVKIGEKESGLGEGRSKKEAEQAAAKIAYEQYKEDGHGE
jgi:ribonuclease-3